MNGGYNQQSYYAIDAFGGSRECTDTPLMVNCCGIARMTKGVCTNTVGGRLDYYLMYIIRGELDATFGGNEYRLQAEDVICIPPRTAYRYECVSESVRYFWIHFTGSEALDTIEISGLAVLEKKNVKRTEESERLYDVLFSEFRIRKENFTYRTALALRNVLLTLGSVEASGSAESGSLDASIKYIHTHLREELSVSALAGMEFMSEGHYRRVFGGIMGCSPSEYIARQRFNRACDMLIGTSESIENIALGIGMSDRTYFQRFFKKRAGITPAEYRRTK